MNGKGAEVLGLLKSFGVDLLGLFRELYKSSLAFGLVGVVALDAWRKRMAFKKLIQAFAVAYIVSIFFPANGLVLISQKQWYENTLNTCSNIPLWVSHVQSWHLDDAFLSDRAVTLAVVFYLTILIGSDAEWYKMIGRLVGFWLLLVGLASASLLLFIKFALPQMIPSINVPHTSSNFAIVDAEMRKSLTWYFNLPVICTANAMCAILFSMMMYEIVKRQPGITRTRLLFHVVCPIIIFTGALISLQLLSFSKGVLWLFFMIVLYAPVLSAIRLNLAGDRSLLAMYAKGARSAISWLTTEKTAT